MHQTLRAHMDDLISQAMGSAQAAADLPGFPLPDPAVERSRRAEHGDYSTAVCLRLAREARMSPLQVARHIIAHLPPSPLLGHVEAVPPGYVNMWLDEPWLAAQAAEILAAGATFGALKLGQGRRVQVEFVSANPTGPLHVGSARNAVIGDALAAILDAAGYAVEREYYVNDAGSQVRIFGGSVLSLYAEALGQEIPFPENGYRGAYVAELGRQLAAQEGDRYLQMEPGQAVRALADWAMGQVLAGIEHDLADLGVHLDTWRHERSFYEEGLFERILALLREKGYVVEHDDAVWFRHPDLEKDAVLIRSAQVVPEPSERPTYLASDVAYLWDKLVERGFEQAIYVWGADHHGDVPRVQAAARALELDPDRAVFILYQLVSLHRGGEEVRMSKRTGEFVTLRDLLDEIGPDAIRFMLLARTADVKVDLDLDLAVEQSERNPVYYVQYAHARIASILRFAQEQGWSLDEVADLSALHHPSELALVRKMLELPEIVELAANKLSAHFLPFYAQELAATFHAFYRDCRVISPDPADAALTRARLQLVQAAKAVLARVLNLMGMAAPERM